eukprot:10966719-Heterocapsa_arctica.AAC.1
MIVVVGPDCLFHLWFVVDPLQQLCTFLLRHVVQQSAYPFFVFFFHYVGHSVCRHTDVFDFVPDVPGLFVDAIID